MKKIPIIITTSDLYHHCLPVFIKCFQRNWDTQFDQANDPVELVGYKKPEIELPCGWTFVSLGKQRGPKYFSDDLSEYFKNQPQWFTWLMEDQFIRSFCPLRYRLVKKFCIDGIGRINLTTDGMKRPHVKRHPVYYSLPDTIYRLSTMPSIWNRDFLLKYMTPGLDPWAFEKQPTDDKYEIVGLMDGVLECNEGVRKHDIHKLNLEGIEL